jgi:hypothetical protein
MRVRVNLSCRPSRVVHFEVVTHRLRVGSSRAGGDKTVAEASRLEGGCGDGGRARGGAGALPRTRSSNAKLERRAAAAATKLQLKHRPQRTMKANRAGANNEKFSNNRPHNQINN